MIVHVDADLDLVGSDDLDAGMWGAVDEQRDPGVRQPLDVEGGLGAARRGRGGVRLEFQRSCCRIVARPAQAEPRIVDADAAELRMELDRAIDEAKV